MTERSTFDPFERRLADELDRYAARAIDPRRVTEIAEAAMRPPSLVARARSAARPRRHLLLGLAAVLLLPAALLATGGIRPPSPDPVTDVQPAPTDRAQPTVTLTGSVPIFVRRHEGPAPGVAVLAVAADGTEVLVRTVRDADVRDALGEAVPGRGRVSTYAQVSASGWLALSTDSRGWPMVLVDLLDAEAAPWVVGEADLGAIGPRWGPSGLIAAFADWSTLVIADPATRTTRMLPMRGTSLVGGGPSIVWAADGSGIVGSNEAGAYEIVPLDGDDPRAGVSGVLDRNGYFGPGMATLTICLPGQGCRGGDDGRIERIDPGLPARTIWQPQGDDRVLAAAFGAGADEYWLSLDRGGGRQVALVHLQSGLSETAATIGRRADWQYVGAPTLAPDASALVVGVNVGDASGAVVAPLDGAPPTFHVGTFAGFADGTALSERATDVPATPAETLPVAGEPYRLPSLDQLIAAELRLNPGRSVLGRASRDGVDGQPTRRTFEVHRDRPGAGEAYLDCIGPASVTVTSGAHSTTSPCLSAGANAFQVNAGGPITVSATGDTSWRVVLYSQ